MWTRARLLPVCCFPGRAQDTERAFACAQKTRTPATLSSASRRSPRTLHRGPYELRTCQERGANRTGGGCTSFAGRQGSRQPNWVQLGETGIVNCNQKTHCVPMCAACLFQTETNDTGRTVRRYQIMCAQSAGSQDATDTLEANTRPGLSECGDCTTLPTKLSWTR